MVSKHPKLFKGASAGYIEDTIRQRLVEMINEIIKEENLPLERADVQVEKKQPDGSSRKFPDIIIWKTVLVKPICHIELKDPTQGWSPYNFDLIEDAQKKANLPPTSPFFATWNINELILWKTYEEALSWEDKKKAVYKFVKIKELRDLDDPEVQIKIKETLRVFLKDLVQFVEGKKELPTIPIDEFFIDSLGTIVDALYYSIALETKEKFKKEKEFRESLRNWFVSQGWIAPVAEETEAFEKVARQFLYLLLNKIMFYNTLRKNFPSLEPIKIKDEIEEGEALKKELQRYFEKAEEVTKDFEAIFSYDFLERIPIPKEVVQSLRSFINGFSKYDFSKLGYKDIGHIFDRLIPNEERHKLGQYFTNPDVVDIINTFCIRSPDDKIADFGCGAGTFLVRAYARIKYLSPNKQHGEILKQLIGVDISKFAAHLTMINLTARDLSKIENPIVICKDFFDISPSSRYKDWKEIPAEGLRKENIKVEIPAELDAVVGNPPYTRQEEIEDYIENYKGKLQQTIKTDWGENIKLSKRAGIYVYFFIHGLRFLKNSGRFGYITSNSWLDVDYGKDLQEFLLKHSKIIAIIETKERVFPDADINTVITILEKCNNEKERNANLVKFVKLKTTLKELIPYTSDNKRLGFLQKLIELIETTNTLYEDENLRIYPKLQAELWKEGYDEEEGQYVGSKWGKYIRAPDVFFKILGNGKFFPLGQVYQVRKGYMRTPYKVFCLNQKIIKEHKIENKFLKPVFSVAKSAKYVYMSKNKLEKLLMVDKSLEDLKGTHLLQYIKYAEENHPELKKVRNWWQLERRKPGQIVVVRTPFNRHVVILNDIHAYVYDHNEIIVNSEHAKSLCAILNSTLYILFREIFARTTLGLGTLKLEKIDLEKIPIIDINKISIKLRNSLENTLEKLSKREIESVFKEVGTYSPEEVSLKKVKPDRRELDKIVMGNILGLTEEEQLEVYKAVVQLVKERIEKAKSVKKEGKSKGVDVEKIADGILREVDIRKLKKFPEDYLPSDTEIEKIIKIPEGEAKISSDLQGYFVEIEKKKIRCASKDEAKWVYYSALFKNKEAKLPKDKKLMKNILENFEKVYLSLVDEIKEKLESYIPKSKSREKIKAVIEKKTGIKLK